MLTVLPKGPNILLSRIRVYSTLSQYLDSYLKQPFTINFCTVFLIMLYSNVHLPCIYLCAMSTNQLTKAGLSAVFTKMAGGSLYIVPNHSVTSALTHHLCSDTILQMFKDPPSHCSFFPGPHLPLCHSSLHCCYSTSSKGLTNHR